MGTEKNSSKTARVMSLLGKGSDKGNPVLGAVSESDTAAAQDSLPTAPGTSLALRANDRPGSLTAAQQIEYIDLDRLDDDPRNFYELSGLEELAASIELLGLQQPLLVRPAAAPDRYVIVSGHRRRAAARKLVEDGKEGFRALPCIVERNEDSPAMQELRLIMANSDTRKLTPAEVGRQAERVEELLYQLKEEGCEFPGRMRDHVAAACKVSASKLARLEVIRKNLEGSWRTGWDKGKLAESAAYALAQMPQERQRVIFDGLKKNGEYPTSVYESMIQSYGQSLIQAEKIQCETYGKGPCLNRENMQKRIMGGSCYSYNYCRQCCDKCPELARCKYACPMLADRVKQLKADAKARRQQEQQAREERERPQAEAIRAIWDHFGRARLAAGKTVEECFQAAGMKYHPKEIQKAITEHEERESLAGKFSKDTDLPLADSYNFYVFQKYVKLADLLGVSLDYLLGRTDEPRGSGPCAGEGQLVLAVWMPGGTTPFQACDVVADFARGDGDIVRDTCRFSNGRFHYDGSCDDIDWPVVRWMALPPVSDSDTGRAPK